MKKEEPEDIEETIITGLVKRLEQLECICNQHSVDGHYTATRLLFEAMKRTGMTEVKVSATVTGFTEEREDGTKIFMADSFVVHGPDEKFSVADVVKDTEIEEERALPKAVTAMTTHEVEIQVHILFNCQQYPKTMPGLFIGNYRDKQQEIMEAVGLLVAGGVLEMDSHGRGFEVYKITEKFDLYYNNLCIELNIRRTAKVS